MNILFILDLAVKFRFTDYYYSIYNISISISIYWLRSRRCKYSRIIYVVPEIEQ
jgi:hypothetical protein